MSQDITAVNHAILLWAGAMGRACWQGSLALALTALLGHAWPRLSPSTRCWLWRLAALKLLAALVWLPPVNLPLLPAQASAARFRINTEARRHEGSTEIRRFNRPDLRVSSVCLSPCLRVNSRRFALSPVMGLLMLWLAGVGGGAIGFAREARARDRRREACRPLRDAELAAACHELCRGLGLPRAPRLLETAEGGSPWLEGIIAPAIIFPRSLRPACSPRELRLMLAHELAHLKRRDLEWSWLAAAAHGLFFFHPLVWLAGREWRLAQEMACDEIAMAITDAPADEYGGALLKVAAQRQAGLPAGAGAVGVMESYHTLKRRLMSMKSMEGVPSGRRGITGTVLTTFAILGLVPWRVVAQEPPVARRSAATPWRPARRLRREPRVRIAERPARSADAGARIGFIPHPPAASRRQPGSTDVAPATSRRQPGSTDAVPPSPVVGGGGQGKRAAGPLLLAEAPPADAGGEYPKSLRPNGGEKGPAAEPSPDLNAFSPSAGERRPGREPSPARPEGSRPGDPFSGRVLSPDRPQGSRPGDPFSGKRLGPAVDLRPGAAAPPAGSAAPEAAPAPVSSGVVPPAGAQPGAAPMPLGRGAAARAGSVPGAALALTPAERETAPALLRPAPGSSAAPTPEPPRLLEIAPAAGAAPEPLPGASLPEAPLPESAPAGAGFAPVWIAPEALPAAERARLEQEAGPIGSVLVDQRTGRVLMVLHGQPVVSVGWAAPAAIPLAGERPAPSPARK